jgi:hypothetical protein
MALSIVIIGQRGLHFGFVFGAGVELLRVFGSTGLIYFRGGPNV